MAPTATGATDVTDRARWSVPKAVPQRDPVSHSAPGRVSHSALDRPRAQAHAQVAGLVSGREPGSRRARWIGTVRRPAHGRARTVEPRALRSRSQASDWPARAIAPDHSLLTDPQASDGPWIDHAWVPMGVSGRVDSGPWPAQPRSVDSSGERQTSGRSALR